MQAACSQCGAKYVLDDKKIADHPRIQFRCGKCGNTTVVELTQHPDRTRATSTLPSFARGDRPSNIEGTMVSEHPGLVLPQDRTITLSIISGPGKGAVHTMVKPRVVLGRSGADMELNDPEASRAHCALEVKQDSIRLRDLESTNGTYVNDERVRAAELSHLSEFRIGNTVVLVTVTPKHEP